MCRAYLAIVLLIFAKAAVAIPVPKGLDTCVPLSACLTLLDKVVPAQDDGEGSSSAIVAHDLRRFGEPAKPMENDESWDTDRSDLFDHRWISWHARCPSQ